MGVRISTDYRGVKVWRSDRGEKPSYAIQVSRKEGDTWINDYQKVRFKGGADIPNGTTVFIRDGFPTLDTWVNDGVEYHRIVWMIMEYDYEGQKEKPQKSFVEIPDYPDSFAAMDADLPF